MSMEDLAFMDRGDVLQALGALAEACSTAQITVTIDEEQVHVERMDARAGGGEKGI